MDTPASCYTPTLNGSLSNINISLAVEKVLRSSNLDPHFWDFPVIENSYSQLSSFGFLPPDNLQPHYASKPPNTVPFYLFEDFFSLIGASDVQNSTYIKDLAMEYSPGTYPKPQIPQVGPFSSPSLLFAAQTLSSNIPTTFPSWTTPLIVPGQEKNMNAPLLNTNPCSFLPSSGLVSYSHKSPMISEDFDENNTTHNISFKNNKKYENYNKRNKITKNNKHNDYNKSHHNSHYGTTQTTDFHNPNARKSKERVYYSKLHMCGICDYWSDHKSNRDRHFVKHYPDHKKHKCPDCKSDFDSKYNLKRHILGSKRCKASQAQQQ
ncbi:C2H2-type zinc finger transcription factor [Phycomyces blakesleeanus]|uniref:C2H2-type zinc finger transcription factor n=2 Tax=Phycomyces blakesleeanus TaxID=4837 RepID=A0A163BG83_PHYB8|nr:C2H2-type zinc finger transcription factor [Phycomyces blakesleeanus NRRL 1555(-)]OAD81381.1 C2H2-type zinc finger transcription factor [Phycomyces blakesleeanus NRRL 1555(-)]|eukprot:XP_018299421.1 C2H2-type zinc finger transcription factor [Phycomyces blakesleeanus NRRL 1555(-)]